MRVCTASEPWYVGEGLDPPGVPVLRYSQLKANPQKFFAFCEFALFFSLIQIVLRGRGKPLPYSRHEQGRELNISEVARVCDLSSTNACKYIGLLEQKQNREREAFRVYNNNIFYSH